MLEPARSPSLSGDVVCEVTLTIEMTALVADEVNHQSRRHDFRILQGCSTQQTLKQSRRPTFLIIDIGRPL